MTETYLCLICVHLLGLKSDDRMTLLRYVAFAALLVGKLADGWDAMPLQSLVLTLYAVVPLAQMGRALVGGGRDILPRLGRKLPYNKAALKPALGCLAAGVAIFAYAGRYDSKRGIDYRCEILLAATHVIFGVGTYYLWRLLPCFDKADEMPLFK